MNTIAPAPSRSRCTRPNNVTPNTTSTIHDVINDRLTNVISDLLREVPCRGRVPPPAVRDAAGRRLLHLACLDILHAQVVAEVVSEGWHAAAVRAATPAKARPGGGQDPRWAPSGEPPHPRARARDSSGRV